MSTEHEDAVLYLAIWGHAQEAFSIITVDDFTPGDRQALAAIVERGYLDGLLNAPWVKDEAIKLGAPSVAFVASICTAGFSGSVGYYAEKMREESTRRYASAALTRGLQKLSHNGTNVYDVVDETINELHAMPSPMTSDDDTWTLDEIMGLTVTHGRFTVPNMLRRNERLVLTGSEGGGKSVFIYQMLTGAAFGVDTFTQTRTEPQKVLFLDVENNEFQARGNLDKIVPQLRQIAPDVDPQWRSMKRRVVNLLATKDKADVIRRIVHYSPDILYMGTAYKLTDVADEQHRAVRAIQSTVDRIREEIDCTVVIEHHAGHGFNNDRNSMRPEGSSYWLRWPDFGFGMKALRVDNGGRLMRLQRWRGDRSDDRRFPAAMRSGGVLPWTPIMEDEWEAGGWSARYDQQK